MRHLRDGNCVDGGIDGIFLRSAKLNEYKKTAYIAGGGCVLIALSLSLWPVYPPIKKIWTTSFNFLAGGSSMLLFALFYFVIDVLKVRKWTIIFTIIGMNSITIYMAARIVNFKHISHFFFGGLGTMSGEFKQVIILAGVFIIEWLLLYALYRKKIFLRV